MTMSNSSDALIPGYTLVDQFGADDEYECDDDGQIVEEVEYVTLDLGFVEPTLVPSSSSYRLIVSSFSRFSTTFDSMEFFPYRD